MCSGLFCVRLAGLRVYVFFDTVFILCVQKQDGVHAPEKWFHKVKIAVLNAPVGLKAHEGVGDHLIDQLGGIHVMVLPFFRKALLLRGESYLLCGGPLSAAKAGRKQEESPGHRRRSCGDGGRHYSQKTGLGSGPV